MLEELPWLCQICSRVQQLCTLIVQEVATTVVVVVVVAEVGKFFEQRKHTALGMVVLL